MERIKHPQKLGDHLSERDAHDVSFVAFFEGFVDDLVRLHRSVGEHADNDWELVVIDNPGDDEGSDRIASLERVVHVPLKDPVGWAAARNLGMRLATGRVACVIDSSVELTGPIHIPLDDPAVGLVGRWGVVTHDGFHFEESEGPDVDGVEGYFMAMRRTDLMRTGLFDPKFRWYRNADIDFSFKVRDAGFKTIVDPTLPLARHEHRKWESTPEAERDELSRKNFGRFRQHWGERPDLFQGVRS